MSSQVKETHEPFVRLVKRPPISGKQGWMIRIIAILGALLTGALVILFLGHNPFLVYRDMVIGAIGTPTVRYETVKIAVFLLITAIGVAIAFKMKFWNIGAEGQILIGAICAGYFAMFQADNMPKIVLIPVMIIAGMMGGALFGVIPALFKAKWGTNETLFTLMLNYIALAVMKYLQNGPWKDPTTQFPKMKMIDDSARLTKVLGVHWGWIIALILVVVAYIYFTKTKQGYEVAVVGVSENTASYAGINVKKVMIRTMVISGALAGLAGMLQLAGADYTLTENTAGGVGFTAITVAWLAKMNPYGMLATATLIAILERGANKIQTTFKIPASASEVLIGIVLFFMLGCELFMTYKAVFRGKKEV